MRNHQQAPKPWDSTINPRQNTQNTEIMNPKTNILMETLRDSTINTEQNTQNTKIVNPNTNILM